MGTIYICTCTCILVTFVNIKYHGRGVRRAKSDLLNRSVSPGRSGHIGGPSGPPMYILGRRGGGVAEDTLIPSLPDLALLVLFFFKFCEEN